MKSEATIWVVGSLNADLVQHVDRIPKPGETISGADLETYPGGKGANQACAASRLGGNVRMIGNLGNDELGLMLNNSLIDAGVDVRGVERVEASTGAASIFVLENGDNAIVVSPGANGQLSPEDVRARLSGIKRGDFLLCQLETPIETVTEAITLAREAGATTILDPAPAMKLLANLLSNVDILTPNETETQTILGIENAIDSSRAGLETHAQQLRAQGPNGVILKLGDAGCLYSNGTGLHVVDGHKVRVVDTTGAGDTFNGALAVALGEESSILEALGFANAAAALSVTLAGAQTSIPDRAAVESFMKTNEVPHDNVTNVCKGEPPC